MRREENHGHSTLAIDGAAVSHRGDKDVGSGNGTYEDPHEEVTTQFDFHFKSLSTGAISGKCLVYDSGLSTEDCDATDTNRQGFSAMNIYGPEKDGAAAAEVVTTDGDKVFCVKTEGGSATKVELKAEDECTERLDKTLIFKEIGTDCFQVEPFDSDGAQCLRYDSSSQELVFEACSEETYWTSRVGVSTCEAYPTTTSTFSYIPANESSFARDRDDGGAGGSGGEGNSSSGTGGAGTGGNQASPPTPPPTPAPPPPPPAWESFVGWNMLLKSKNNLCLRVDDDGQLLESATCNSLDRQQQFIATGIEEPNGNDFAENITSMYNGKILCFDGNANTLIASDNCEKEYHEILIDKHGKHCFRVKFRATSMQERQANKGIQPTERCMSFPGAMAGAEEMVTTAAACTHDGSLWQRYGDQAFADTPEIWNACN
jgi:hypothetical protein